MSEISPLDAASVIIDRGFNKGKFWVILHKITPALPTIGFKLETKDSGRRIKVSDHKRLRRIRQMREDGLPWHEIESIEGQLSPKERFYFKGETK